MNYDIIQHIDNLNVHKGKRYKDYKIQPHHYHNWYEIFIVTSGSCEFSVYDKFFRVNAGTAMMLSPGVFHYYTSTEGCEYTIIEITAGYMSRYFSNDASKMLFQCFNSQTISLSESEIMKCIDFCQIADNESNSSVSDKFIAIASVLNLLNNATQNTLKIQTNLERKKSIEKLNYITNYISDNFKEINSISELAKACYISKSHMCRIFKEQLGVSVSSYINNIKINTARELLISGDMSILEIALESGFNSTQYFHKVFKSQLGCSPKEYRTINRINPLTHTTSA